MSRTILTAAATIRPYSRRKTSATRAATSRSRGCPWPVEPTGRYYSIRPRPSARAVRSPFTGERESRDRSHLPDRTHVDEAALAERDLLGPLHRLFPGVALDQIEAAECLLRLGERSIHDLAMAGLETDPARIAVRAQALAVDHFPRRLKLGGETPVALHHCLHLGFRRRGGILVIRANEQHVTHGNPPRSKCRGRSGSACRARYVHPSSTTPTGRRNRQAGGEECPATDQELVGEHDTRPLKPTSSGRVGPQITMVSGKPSKSASPVTRVAPWRRAVAYTSESAIARRCASDNSGASSADG